VFGIEAAARRHFGTTAADLTARQAALLAAVIINPRRFSAESPTPRIERRMRMILGRMRRRGFISEDEYLVAIGKAPRHFFNPFEWLFGPSSHERAPEASQAPVDTGSGSLPPDTSSAAPADSLPD
jgi:membrane peptidoglycan carboxypeptidase